jgi:hypothetical protein
MLLMLMHLHYVYHAKKKPEKKKSPDDFFTDFFFHRKNLFRTGFFFTGNFSPLREIILGGRTVVRHNVANLLAGCDISGPPCDKFSHCDAYILSCSGPHFAPHHPVLHLLQIYIPLCFSKGFQVGFQPRRLQKGSMRGRGIFTTNQESSTTTTLSTSKPAFC